MGAPRDTGKIGGGFDWSGIGGLIATELIGFSLVGLCIGLAFLLSAKCG